MTSMFSTPKRNEGYGSSSDQPPANVTVIARGVRVEGNFASQGDVLIEGEVHGQVSTNGLLTIGPEAKLKADVTAQDAVIAGTVEGNLTVKKRVELKATAKLIGDLVCETAVIESGAAMSGKVTIGSAPKIDPSAKGDSNKGQKNSAAS